MISWIYFPKNSRPPQVVLDVVKCFQEMGSQIDSIVNDDRIGEEGFDASSNSVLSIMAPSLSNIGFRVESGKRSVDKIQVPVLFGENGRLEKTFDVDAYNHDERCVIEIEAGRAVSNYQFLKDIFQACLMADVDYLVVAVRQVYRGGKDYHTVKTFLEALYSSGRLQLPLKGILLVGY
jgi:hypothetical protein